MNNLEQIIKKDNILSSLEKYVLLWKKMRVPKKDIYILVHPYTYIRNMTSLYLTVISGCNGIYEVLQCAVLEQIKCTGEKIKIRFATNPI